MTNDMKVNIKAVVSAIHDGMVLSAQNEHRDTVAKLMDKHGDQLLNPDNFHVLIDFPHEEMTEVLIRTLLQVENTPKGIAVDEDTLYKLIQLYQDYAMVDGHIDGIIEEYEGVSCSSDKTRFILRAYRTYLMNQTVPEWTNRGKYSVPRYGEPTDWFAFIDSALGLSLGQAKRFVASYQRLTEHLEEEQATFLKDRRDTFMSHNRFTGKKEHAKNDVFSFSDGEYDLEIHLAPNHRDGYVCMDKETGKRLEYKDKKAQWVKDLLEFI